MSGDWPTCRHRGPALDDARCRCDHPRLHAPAGVTLEGCRRCAAGGVYCDSQERQPIVASAPRTQPCDHLGPILDRRNALGEPCACPGKWIRHCELHGRCTLSDVQRLDVPRCTTCADYTVG